MKTREAHGLVRELEKHMKECNDENCEIYWFYKRFCERRGIKNEKKMESSEKKVEKVV